MLADLGLTVARTIPAEALLGLASGAYKANGGVIRDAGGRIVMHLVTSNVGASALSGLVPGANLIGSLIQSGQLWQLGRNVDHLRTAVSTVLSVSMAGVAVSGLGVVTSIAGFAYLTKRIGQIDAKLVTIERDVKGIKNWLGSLERSKLRAAVDNVRHALTSSDEALRRDLLIQSKDAFGMLVHHYREQWAEARTTIAIRTIDDLYSLAIAGQAITCSSLGLFSDAADDLDENSREWLRQARGHTKAMIFDERPDRLLSAEYVDKLPARTLTQLLDFAHDSDRGIDWLDELRLGAGKNSSILDGLTGSTARMERLIGKGDVVGAVDVARSLYTRADVIGASVAHYDFLRRKGISAFAFEKLVEAERVTLGAEAICIFPTLLDHLQPVSA